MRLLGAVALAAAALLAVPAAPVAAAERSVPHAFEIGGAAAMPYLAPHRELPTYAGFSRVRLWEGRAPWNAEPALPTTGCEAFGAGTWLGDEVEGRGPLGEAAAPRNPYDEDSGIRNPTVSRSVNPAPDPRLFQRWPSEPGLSNPLPPGQTLVPIPAEGIAPHWAARCHTRTAGEGLSGLSHLSNLEALGSSTHAVVNPATGAYTGFARSFATAVHSTDGTPTTVASTLRVRAGQGREPLVDFYLAVGGGRTPTPRSSHPDGAIVLSLTQVPARLLVVEFARVLGERRHDLERILGPAELRMLAPEVSHPARGGVMILAPVLALESGPTIQEITLGSRRGVRLGATWFASLPRS